MKITMNALQLKNQSSGIGVLIRELFEPFSRTTSRPIVAVYSKDSPAFHQDAENITAVFSPFRYNQGIGRMLYQSFVLGVRHCKQSVLLTTDSKIPLLMPKSCFLLPLITDLAVYRMADTYQKSRVLWWRMQYRLMTRRANHFLAISEYTKKDMIELLHIPPEKIDVVYCAASDHMVCVEEEEALSEVRARYQLPPHYILFVGNFNPRKNLERCIEAFAEAKESGLPHKLVIVGAHGWKFDKATALGQSPFAEEILFPGFIPDEDMPAVYSGAELFLFPTLYEGFGIPVIEAQLCRVPVLTSNCSALPEVGGTGAYYVDPTDRAAISKGILEILKNPALAHSLVENGTENAKRFSWEKSAEKLNEIIERICVL